MKYLFITLDAIRQFATVRQFQSIEFRESKLLCSVLKANSTDWESSKYHKIRFEKNPKGGAFFYTNLIDKKHGIIFDFSYFDGFKANNDDKIITIFQKTLKYAIRYFENLPLAASEKIVQGTSTTIVYPFPFTPTKDAYKVLVDRNSSKMDRKGKNILTVFYSGIKDDAVVQFANLNKAVEEINDLTIIQEKDLDEELVSPIGITDLDATDLSIDSKIGYDNWDQYLTDKQKAFVNADIRGPERLEGAAGTGKTLTMILRCVNIIKKKVALREDYPIVFITHSISTKNQIIEIFRNNYPEIDNYMSNQDEIRYLLVTTLQEWCIKYLGAYISDTEYLDKDAKDSKGLQLLYIEEAFSKVKQRDFETYKKICSEKFIHFINTTNHEALLEMLQYEIAVTIKGRAEGNIDKYKKLTRQTYSIPCNSPNDLSFLYLIYQTYQESLENIGQYDSDDIILTALGQLNTPIWKRRRNKEGFQACFIDETHLFNLNELAIFHYLNNENAKNNIVFSIDKSQAVGERGILDNTMYEILGITSPENSHKFGTVFRSSPDIINLAFNILSSGATFFTNFENPLDYSFSSFTGLEEKKCRKPRYVFLENDEEAINQAFHEAELYAKNVGAYKSKILIASTDDYLLSQLESYAKKGNKPFEVLKSRGDSVTINKANTANRFLIGGIDYVGGLEFDAVIIVGVDKGRVPPNNNATDSDSFHFLNYAWHNRMYVAITRAKYSIVLIGDKSRGKSPLLESAIYSEIIDVEGVEL